MSPPARRAVALALLLPALAAGCAVGDDDPGFSDLSENTAVITVQEMGVVGARVYLEPERAEAIVIEAGLTPAEFESRIRSITDDPNKSLVYARAFEAELSAAATPGG